MNLVCNCCDVLHNVFDPSAVIAQNFVANRFRLASPVFNVLTKVAHFRGYGRDSESGKEVIVSISSHFVTNYLIRITFHYSVWEWSVLSNILENGERTRNSLFYIIWFTTIEWPYEIITRSMAIDNEFDIVFLRGDEIS
jgi:cytosine/uracil/thiamine/allantoin permease